MNVLVLAAMTPFASGDADAVRQWVGALCDAGAKAEAMRVPLPRLPPDRAMDAMLLARSLRIVNTDRLLALGFPACLVPHAAKFVWLDAADAQAPPAALRTALGDARAVFTADAALAATMAREHACPVEHVAAPGTDADALRRHVVARLLA